LGGRGKVIDIEKDAWPVNLLGNMKIITAPSNVGLRPLWPGHEPGTWKAPAALLAAGLLKAIGAVNAIAMPRPTYKSEADRGTRLRNGLAMRKFNLALADEVAEHCRQGEFVLILGGDCSILLGALAGARRNGTISLVHIDGHSDFRHPGNYDTHTTLGAVAGMDLALATGRGEPIMTQWPQVAGPLVNECHIVQIGERESRDPDFAWPDISDTAINCIDVFEASRIGAACVLERVWDTLDAVLEQDFWVHLDVDVLDQAVMPAVDSPGSPGISPSDLVTILSPLVSDRRCAGMTVTDFDPELDPEGKYARTIVELLGKLTIRNCDCSANTQLSE
jgi:arginase